MKKIMLFLAASCGVALAVACSSGDDNSNGNGDSGGGSGTSSGSASGSSGSTSGTTSGTSSGSAEAGGATCTSKAQCTGPQVCCGGTSFTASCQAPPCPSTPLGPVQLCSSSAECVNPGDQCLPLSIPGVMLPVQVNRCTPSDGGAAGDGGHGDGATSGDGGGAGDAAGGGDAGDAGGGDAAAADAATGG